MVVIRIDNQVFSSFVPERLISVLAFRTESVIAGISNKNREMLFRTLIKMSIHSIRSALSNIESSFFNMFREVFRFNELDVFDKDVLYVHAQRCPESVELVSYFSMSKVLPMS